MLLNIIRNCLPPGAIRAILKIKCFLVQVLQFIKNMVYCKIRILSFTNIKFHYQFNIDLFRTKI